ncbi:MAG: hypothetical protein V7704_02240 [Aurantimonas endophytica]|uniref:hypothetical protein n=1 Tax=Aurantimonas endophytica TaxID=1522175 RepID=UPI00300324C8
MSDAKPRQGTPAWFEMVGRLMRVAALQTPLSPDLNLSLVERYTDGAEMPGGLVQGLRLDIRNGKPTFRVGARHGERGDVTIEITAAAARTLNRLRSDDPEFQATRDGILKSGEMRVDGDPAAIGSWLEMVHDPIVDRTL